MSDSQTLTAARTPTVYFIDDSATMREVIKIAFRKESIHVITCPDAASALAQFGEAAPDAVITDVIMPDKDGYEVCRFIKEHEQFGKTPVILMSGVVNRDVAEKAMAVKADELVRKPFQPQDLIVRVKNLLYPNARSVVAPPASDENAGPSASASQVLSGLFAPAAPATGNRAPRPAHAYAQPQTPVAVAPPRAFAPAASVALPPQRATAPPPPNAELVKLRNEARRLELLVKKLQAELEAQHQYSAALEAHIKTLQEVE
jgi:DNA-binding response OmpR family regulator